MVRELWHRGREWTEAEPGQRESFPARQELASA